MLHYGIVAYMDGKLLSRQRVALMTAKAVIWWTGTNGEAGHAQHSIAFLEACNPGTDFMDETRCIIFQFLISWII
jgi:hypothetical protein